MSDLPVVDGVEFRMVPGWGDAYCVSSDGQVWTRNRRGVKKSHEEWKKMSCKPNARSGYRSVSLQNWPESKSIFVHRLALIVFSGQEPHGLFALHCDGNPDNNSIANLRWGTASQNMSDSLSHGSSASGSNHPLALFTDEQIEQIRIDGNINGLKNRLLRIKYNQPQMRFSKILNGTSYPHSPGPVRSKMSRVGSGSGMSKLNESSVAEVKLLLSEGRSLVSIAKQFSVNPTTIGCIAKGVTWASTERKPDSVFVPEAIPSEDDFPLPVIDGETFRFIPEYRGFYAISDTGRVFSCHSQKNSYTKGAWKELKCGIGPVGYRRATLSLHGSLQSLFVHTLVLEAFIGPRPDGYVGCHNNSDPLDNRLSNLRWGSLSDNQADRILAGTDHCGEKHFNANLTVEQVESIRTQFCNGVGQAEIARSLGIARCRINAIVHNRVWKTAPGPIGEKKPTKGATHYKARLSWNDIIEIRRLYDNQLMRVVDIASKFDCKPVTISAIGKRRNRKTS